MVFRKRKERTDRLLDELRLGEFWLMPGEFRAEEATAGMTGSYGLPGGYGALAASAEQEEALRPFHAIVQRTVEEVSAGLPVALTVSDYTGHTCALWRAFQNCAKWRWNSAVGSKKRRWAKGKSIYFSLTGCPKDCIHRSIGVSIRRFLGRTSI